MGDDYAPVGIYDDEEEQLKRGGYAAVQPPIPPPGSAPAGTADLESHITPPHAYAPVTPEAARPQWKDYAPPEQKTWQKILGPIAAGAAGWGNPAAGQHALDMLYVQPRRQAEEDYKRATEAYEAPAAERQKEAETEQKQAQTKEAEARAEKEHAQATAPPKGPKTAQEVYAQRVQEVVAAGGDPAADPIVQKLADTITQIQKPSNAPGNKAVTLKLPSGQQAPGKVDHEGNLLTEDGQPAPHGSMLYQQPNYGQAVLPTKTVQVIGANGLPTVMGWNTETGTYDKPVGVSSTGAYGHEMAQAGAVARGGNRLISDIQANKEKLGDLTAWVKKYGINTPIGDPDLAGLQAELKTFAALQPAMHGFRARSAQEAFENIIGDVQKNPDATIASIKGILTTAGAINPNLAGGNANPSGKVEYKPGLIRNGYKFKGGDPTKQENWEKQ